MVKYLRIQAPGVPTILRFEVDSIEYGDPSGLPGGRKIVGIKSGQPVNGSEFLISSILGWWLEGEEHGETKEFLRVQAPGNPMILRFGIDSVEFGDPKGPLPERNIRAVRDGGLIAEFNVPSLLGWWLDYPKIKYLRIQAPGNPIILRIEIDSLELTSGLPQETNVKGIKAGKVVASFNVPSILGWWLEDENQPEQPNQPAKHLLVQSPDNPPPFLTIEVDSVRVSDPNVSPRENDVIGIKEGEVVARFNIPSIYRYWTDFPVT